MENDTKHYLSDTLMGRPYCFCLNDEHFYLYPNTLGKMLLLQRHVENLEIDKEGLDKNLPVEALRLAKEKTDMCLRIIALYTCRSKEEVFNQRLQDEKVEFFKKCLSYEDIAALLINILTMDKTAEYMRHLGIEEEQKRLNIVMRVKAAGDKNNITFGGKSQFGTLLDNACERYGWTKDYVVWGIDYSSLRLMLADKITSVYCTDEEMKKIPASVKNPSEEVVKATKENIAEIKNMDWR